MKPKDFTLAEIVLISLVAWTVMLAVMFVVAR